MGDFQIFLLDILEHPALRIKQENNTSLEIISGHQFHIILSDTVVI